MLKARRKHQKTRNLLDVEAKRSKRLAKQALAGPTDKKEKVKKVKAAKAEPGGQDAKQRGADTSQKGVS
jgi:hypothetical protein